MSQLLSVSFSIDHICKVSHIYLAKFECHDTNSRELELQLYKNSQIADAYKTWHLALYVGLKDRYNFLAEICTKKIRQTCGVALHDMEACRPFLNP